jgi:hypothetical protein
MLDNYDLDVVGEASYQDRIARIVGGKTPEGVTHECQARLFPEPTNPFDENAVAVTITGSVVGYLPHALAEVYLRNHSGQATVDAVIVGGWKDGEDEGNFGVRLNGDTITLL